MTAEPDAWDECAACGHDRDDHDAAACHAYEVTFPGPGNLIGCPCTGFEAAA